MATTLFRCATCGYRADVLAASERDHEVKRKAMVCRQCRAVVDTVVARLEPGENEFGMPVDRWHAVVAICPLCRGTNVGPWALSRPCPRCDGEMDEL